MNIAGLQKTSLIDYPGKVAAIIFTQGCQFRCGFCHNPELLPALGEVLIPEDEIINFLKNRQGKLDGLVITGGEPTLQADLQDFIIKVRSLGYLVKLDTNGTKPELLKKLIANKLVDYIAMDIKAPLIKYNKVTGTKVNKEKIKQSIKLIMSSGFDYEFRSTVLPAFHTAKDVVAMARLIKGAKKYYLQKFVNQGKLFDKTLVEAKSFSNTEMQALAKDCLKFVGCCEVR